MSMVGKVIGVVSGKGGVGKSLVTELAAVELRRRGLSVGIMDADVTGPSIPKAFGLSGVCEAAPLGGILPKETKTGIKVMSVNLLLEDITSPLCGADPSLRERSSSSGQTLFGGISTVCSSTARPVRETFR